MAGPVGAGKSAVIAKEICTDEDARLLKAEGVLPDERVRAVETGACPHAAIRDGVTINLLAVEDMEQDFAPLEVVLVESGGDYPTATFSPSTSTRWLTMPRALATAPRCSAVQKASGEHLEAQPVGAVSAAQASLR